MPRILDLVRGMADFGPYAEWLISIYFSEKPTSFCHLADLSYDTLIDRQWPFKVGNLIDIKEFILLLRSDKLGIAEIKAARSPVP